MMRGAIGHWKLFSMIKVGKIGQISRDLDRYAQRLESASQKAVRKSAFNSKKSWGSHISGAGLGSKLPRSIRYKFYKNEGHDAAAIVYTKAHQILRGFDQGATLKSRTGKYIAVPTKYAPKRSERKRVTPRNFPARLGKLIFVPARGSRPALLVVKNARKSYSKKDGRFRGVRAASKRAIAKGESETIVMFTLHKQVKMRKRTNMKMVIEREVKKLPALIDQEMSRAK